MDISIFDFAEGANKAGGAVVVIDVFRAFSVACWLLANGASRIIAVDEPEEAWKLKGELADLPGGAVLVGERGGKKLAGFDFGNSPTEIEKVDFGGRTIVQTTHAGTQGLIHAKNAEFLFTASLVNAKATALSLKKLAPAHVSLVRMGLEGRERSDEDDLCAEYLEALLTGRTFDVQGIRDKLRRSPYSARFFDPAKPWSPPTDFFLCTEIDRFNFAVRAARLGEHRVELTMSA